MDSDCKVEAAAATKVIRYSRETLLSLNVPTSNQNTERILQCLRPYHIDKGNLETIVKTDNTTNMPDVNAVLNNLNPNVKRTPIDAKVRSVMAPQTVPNMPTHRALDIKSPPVSPVSMHTLARTPLASLSNQPVKVAPASAQKTPAAKYQPVKAALKENDTNRLVPQQKSVKENVKENPKANAKAKTPNKKVYVEIRKTPASPEMETPVKGRLVQSISQADPEGSEKAVEGLTSPGAALAELDEDTPDGDPNKEETDPHRLQQRQKQIDYGYKTLGYIRYRLMVPKEERLPEQPKTPKKNQSCSKRSWDGQVKKWRRELHLWDPSDPQECEPYFENQLLNTLFEGTLEVESIKKQLEEQVEELRINGCLLLSPNDKHFTKKNATTQAAGVASPSISTSTSSTSSRLDVLSLSDSQPNRIFPSANHYSEDSGDESSSKMPDFLQKQPIARVLVFPAEC